MTTATTLKQSFAITLIVAIAGLLIAASVGAETTDVTATVTPQLVAVSVDDGAVAYGILAADTNQDTLLANLDDTQTAKNDGNVNVDLSIKSSDAASVGTPWNLAAAAGTDAYTHEFSTNSGGNWADFNDDNTTYSSIAAAVVVNGTQEFDLKIGSPTSSTDSVEHTITVTVLATAS